MRGAAARDAAAPPWLSARLRSLREGGEVGHRARGSGGHRCALFGRERAGGVPQQGTAVLLLLEPLGHLQVEHQAPWPGVAAVGLHGPTGRSRLGCQGSVGAVGQHLPLGCRPLLGG